MMRTCTRCKGACVIDTSENDDGSHMEDCWMCSATGEVEDGCYCAARSPYECCCEDWANQKILEADQEIVMNGFLSELKVVFDKYGARMEVGSDESGYGTNYGGGNSIGVKFVATLDGVTASKEINKAVIVSGDLV